MNPTQKEAPKRLTRADRRRLQPRVRSLYESIWVTLADQQAQRREVLLEWLLPLTPVTEIPKMGTSLQLVRAVLLDPTYQLK